MTTLQRLRTGVSSTSRWIRAAVVCLIVAVAMFAAASLGRTSLAQATPTPPPIESQFFYNAGAYALGGITTLVDKVPVSNPLVTQGATMLSRSGGQSVAEVKDFHYNDRRKDLIVIGSAKSTVSGVQGEKGCRVTTTESVVNDLAVDGRLKVSSMTLRTEARQCPESRYENAFKTTGSIQGLTLDGVAVAVASIDRFSKEQSLRSIVVDHQKAAGWMLGPDDKVISFTSLLPDRTWQGPSAVYEDRIVLTSVFDKVGMKELPELEKANPHKDIGKYVLLPGNGIYVPDFGKVYFGQILINRLERRASLLHFKLGSPFDVEMDAGGESSNGSEYP
jgi:hypothetical protein